MKKSDQTTYVTGRGIAALLSIGGWIIVAVGAVALLLSVFFGAFVSIGGVEHAGLVARLFMALPGLLTVVAGLAAVLHAQTARATFDTAQHIRAALPKPGAGAAPGVSLAKTPPTLRAEPPSLRRPAEPTLRRP